MEQNLAKTLPREAVWSTRRFGIEEEKEIPAKITAGASGTSDAVFVASRRWIVLTGNERLRNSG